MTDKNNIENPKTLVRLNNSNSSKNKKTDNTNTLNLIKSDIPNNSPWEKFRKENNKLSSAKKLFENLQNRTKSKEFLNENGISKWQMFKIYWCNNLNRNLNIIYTLKEKLIDKTLSLETLAKNHFDIEMLKILNLNLEDLNSMEDIYYNLFFSSYSYEKLRNHLTENSKETENSLFSLFKTNDNKPAKKLQYFQY